jgi:membrane-bound serine protease (ClpP class)
MQRKVTEDFAARARTLAERRGDDAAEWAEAAVRDAASATEDEALEMGVIDAVAVDPAALFAALDGLEVEVGGETTTLDLAEAELEEVPKSPAEGLLSLLAHPAVALLLLTIGVNAILIELSSPGGFVAGVVGVLALVLAFYSLGVLEANMIGLAFIAAAFVLFVLELQSPTHGLLALGGILLFALGAVILFSGGAYGVPWGAILGLAFGTAVFFAVVVSAIWKTYRRPPTTGEEALVGSVGRALVPLDPGGKVIVLGETWDAENDDAGSPIAEGATVRVVGRDGYVLRVRRQDEA